jgi:hypothetical protein
MTCHGCLCPIRNRDARVQPKWQQFWHEACWLEDLELQNRMADRGPPAEPGLHDFGASAGPPPVSYGH